MYLDFSSRSPRDTFLKVDKWQTFGAFLGSPSKWHATHSNLQEDQVVATLENEVSLPLQAARQALHLTEEGGHCVQEIRRQATHHPKVC